MQVIDAYKIHSKRALKQQVEKLRSRGHHPFSVAASIGDASDWHGDPTYLLDPPIGYSTRSANAVGPYLNAYHIIDILDGD